MGEFRAALERVMGEGLMSNEQDVLYFMYNTMAPKTQLQLYQGTGGRNWWFHLGYLAKDACANKQASVRTQALTSVSIAARLKQ